MPVSLAMKTHRIKISYKYTFVSSAGKESTCNAGDPASIPGLRWTDGEGIGSPLQYSRASLAAQLVKNLPAMWETWVQSLGWEDPMEKGTATHSSILPGEFHGLYSPWGHRVRHDWATFTFTFHTFVIYRYTVMPSIKQNKVHYKRQQHIIGKCLNNKLAQK